MALYSFTGNTEQFGVPFANSMVAIKVDTTISPTFYIIAQTTADSGGAFELSWRGWSGRVIIGAADSAGSVIDCKFHDWETGLVVAETLQQILCIPQEDTYTDLILSKNPIAYYKCDDLVDTTFVRDYSTNESHGSIVGTAGKSFGANSLRSTSKGSSSRYTPLLGNNDYWTIPSGSFNSAKCVEFFGTAMGGSDALFITQSDSSSPRLEIFHWFAGAGGGRYAVSFNGSTLILSNNAYPNERGGVRHHVIQREGSVTCYYIDSVKQAQTTSSNPFTIAAGAVCRVGVRKTSSTAGQANSISDIALYADPLTQDEINERYAELTRDLKTWSLVNKSHEVSIIGERLNVASVSSSGIPLTAKGNVGHITGKRYLEFKLTSPAISGTGLTNLTYFGVCDSAMPLNISNLQSANGVTGSYYKSIIWATSGAIYSNTGTLTSTLIPYTHNDIIRVYVDFDAGKGWFGVNGTVQGSPTAGTSPSFTFTPNMLLMPLFYRRQDSATTSFVDADLRLCQSHFTYTDIPGFEEWANDGIDLSIVNTLKTETIPYSIDLTSDTTPLQTEEHTSINLTAITAPLHTETFTSLSVEGFN